METAACDCGAVETNFFSVREDEPCETCGVSKAPEVSDGCMLLLRVCCPGRGDRAETTRGAARAPGLGVASVWGRHPKADELSSPSVEDQPFETCLLQRSGEAWRLWDTLLRSGGAQW